LIPPTVASKKAPVSLARKKRKDRCDDDSEDETAICICNGKPWKGGNPMCALYGIHDYIGDDQPPAPPDWKEGDAPRTPPPKHVTTIPASSTTALSDLSATFAAEVVPKQKKPTGVSIAKMLKDAREHTRVSAIVQRFNAAADTGKGNRYTGVSSDMFIAAFLDRRCRKGLEKVWMVPEQYKELRAIVLELMVDLVKKDEKETDTNKNGGESEGPMHANAAAAGETDFAFDGAFDYDDNESGDGGSDSDNEERIRIRCEAQLAAYELLDPMKMKTDGKYNNPLQWWAVSKDTYPELAKLAKKYLSIPATSAPSERVWSRTARVLTARRASTSPDLISAIMFVQENVSLIRKHWDELMPGEALSEYFLPPPLEDKDDDGKSTDVGQHDDD